MDGMCVPKCIRDGFGRKPSRSGIRTPHLPVFQEILAVIFPEHPQRFWAILTRVVQTRTIGEPHSGNAATRTGTAPVVHIKGDKMKRALALGSALVVFGLTGTVGAAASPPSPAPCTLGALNMLHDATMATIPMTHDAAQGNAGMSTAVAVSGCK